MAGLQNKKRHEAAAEEGGPWTEGWEVHGQEERPETMV